MGKVVNIYWIYIAVHDETPHNKNMSINIKVGLSPSKEIYVLFTSMESRLKMMKNAFYFIVKALFVLKIFKFLP